MLYVLQFQVFLHGGDPSRVAPPSWRASRTSATVTRLGPSGERSDVRWKAAKQEAEPWGRTEAPIVLFYGMMLVGLHLHRSLAEERPHVESVHIRYLQES